MITMQCFGNLGRDPEVKTSSKGNKYARFSVACNDYKDGEKTTTWVNVTCVDKFKVDIIEKYLSKGSKVLVEGTPDARQYTTSAGEPGVSLDLFMGFGCKLVLAGGGDQPQGDQSAPEKAPDLDDDVPF
jgi:single-strand DNA-binding protein